MRCEDPVNLSTAASHAPAVWQTAPLHHVQNPCVLQHLQNLPEEARVRCEDPTSLYNFGWSHGKESLGNRGPDTHKGSYYANPLLDAPSDDVDLMRRFPAYCR